MTAIHSARPYVKFYASAMQSERVLDLTPTAHKLWTMSLLKASNEQRDGLLPASSDRAVARWSGLPYEDVDLAKTELLAVGLWETVGEEISVGRWLEFQTSEEGLSTRREAARVRKQKSRAAKAKPEAEATAAPDVPEKEKKVVDPRSPAGVREAFVELLDGTDSSVDAYRSCLVEAEVLHKQCAENGIDFKLGHLTNTLVAHAAKRLFPEVIKDRDLPVLYRNAKKLGADAVLFGLFHTEMQPGVDAGKELNYALAIARNKHAELVAS